MRDVGSLTGTWESWVELFHQSWQTVSDPFSVSTAIQKTQLLNFLEASISIDSRPEYIDGRYKWGAISTKIYYPSVFTAGP
jgi:hypothetical protein